jgi:RIO kinase 1
LAVTLHDDLPAELASVEEFFTHGMIDSIIATLKSGKEAATYLCTGGPRLGHDYAVAKVYHDLDRRDFHNDTAYQDGRLILVGQVRRAVEAGTEFGRKANLAMWVDHEFEALSVLQYAGAAVPEPFASTEGAILMEYIGDEDGAAPQLQHVRLTREESESALESLLETVTIFLANNHIHGDLSPFNVLYWKGRPVVIDLPQTVDPRFNRHARELLDRDMANMAKFFARRGVDFDARRWVNTAWQRWRYGELG